MNFDGGYFLTENWGIGAFPVLATTNHEYVPRQTITAGSASLTTDQQHSAFQLPFGLGNGAYAWNRGSAFQPYVGLKAGAQYTRLELATFNIFEQEDKSWGFYVSPEVGINIFPVGIRSWPAHCRLLQPCHQPGRGHAMRHQRP